MQISHCRFAVDHSTQIGRQREDDEIECLQRITQILSGCRIDVIQGDIQNAGFVVEFDLQCSLGDKADRQIDTVQGCTGVEEEGEVADCEARIEHWNRAGKESASGQGIEQIDAGGDTGKCAECKGIARLVENNRL